MIWKTGLFVLKGSRKKGGVLYVIITNVEKIEINSQTSELNNDVRKNR